MALVYRMRAKAIFSKLEILNNASIFIQFDF